MVTVYSKNIGYSLLFHKQNTIYCVYVCLTEK